MQDENATQQDDRLKRARDDLYHIAAAIANKYKANGVTDVKVLYMITQFAQNNMTLPVAVIMARYFFADMYGGHETFTMRDMGLILGRNNQEKKERD